MIVPTTRPLTLMLAPSHVAPRRGRGQGTAGRRVLRSTAAANRRRPAAARSRSARRGPAMGREAPVRGRCAATIRHPDTIEFVHGLREPRVRRARQWLVPAQSLRRAAAVLHAACFSRIVFLQGKCSPTGRPRRRSSRCWPASRPCIRTWPRSRRRSRCSWASATTRSGSCCSRGPPASTGTARSRVSLGVAVYAALRKAGLTIPVPQQEVRLHREPRRPAIELYC